MKYRRSINESIGTASIDEDGTLHLVLHKT